MNDKRSPPRTAIDERGGPKADRAIVLAGGGARGAYEAGVLAFVLDDLAREIGRPAPVDILCGTSVGAVNVCLLAAFADLPMGRSRRLLDAWTKLDVAKVLRPATCDVLSTLARSTGLGLLTRMPKGGLLDPSPLEAHLAASIPFRRIDAHLAEGRLSAVAVSTTRVASGRSVTFVQRASEGLPPWSDDPLVEARVAKIRLTHVRASSAIPFLFPPVGIDGELHCDGGLRQNVPLAPARRLGAERILTVTPHHVVDDAPDVAASRDRHAGNAIFLAGKMLNALVLDRMESDLRRMERINEILLAGEAIYGASFLAKLSSRLSTSHAVRPIRAIGIRSSVNLARIAAETVREPRFRRRAGMAGRVLKLLADSEGEDADFVSHLLFDGEYATRLIEIGRADAAARRDELADLFWGVTSTDERRSA